MNFHSISKTFRKTFVITLCLVMTIAFIPVASSIQSTQEATAANAKPIIKIIAPSTSKVTIKKGATYNIKIKVTKGSKITYKSSKKSVITVKKGKLNAKNLGNATITIKAKKSGKIATKKIKVIVINKTKTQTADKTTNIIDVINTAVNALKDGNVSENTANIKTLQEAINNLKNITATDDELKSAIDALTEAITQKINELQKQADANCASIIENQKKIEDLQKQKEDESSITGKLKDAMIGDYVTFGSYEQDADTSNGKESIEWRVLAKEDGRALLISRYALDCQPYNKTLEDVTWETCTLRAWLNSIFLNKAFTASEQELIQVSTVTADANPNHSDIDPGNDTEDKLFLLSVDEVNKYFDDETRETLGKNSLSQTIRIKTYLDRLCGTTKYTRERGVAISTSYTVGGKAVCSWWLRTPGSSLEEVTRVNTDGSILGGKVTGSYNYSGDYSGVRPAMWISLE